MEPSNRFRESWGCVFLKGLAKKIKKFKFGRFIRGALSPIPVVGDVANAVAGGIRESKAKGRSVNEQISMGLQAGTNELPQVKTQRMIILGLLGVGLLTLVFVVARRK